MSEPQQYRYEAVVKIWTNPVRECASKEDFIELILNEYNVCEHYDVWRSDIYDITSDNPNEED